MKIVAEARVRFQRQAYETWANYYQAGEGEEKSAHRNYVNGTLGCFCNDQYDTLGIRAAFMPFRQDGLSDDADGPDDVDEEKICQKYVL